MDPAPEGTVITRGEHVPLRAATARPLGQMLVDADLLDEETLDAALVAQRRTGEPLGRVLLTSGAVSRLALYEVLARQWGIPFVDLTAAAPDREALDRLGPEWVLANGAIPLGSADPDGLRRRIATTLVPTRTRLLQLAEEFGCGVEDLELVATTDWDLDWAVREWFDTALAEAATTALRDADEEVSAHRVFTKPQKVAGLIACVAFIAALVADWTLTLALTLLVINAMFFTGVVFRYLVSLRGVRARGSAAEDADAAPPERIPDADLPFYTILVPVYHEANIVAHLVQWLAELDYPNEKLEILLLLESDDIETITAAKAASPPDVVRFVIIPDGLPKTKPKACNVGLTFARGEYLVIYDAEDLPEGDQLRKAVRAFQTGGEGLVCVQAALNYFNANQNGLTRMFTLEYSFWFDYMLPGLDAWSLPIPLGGTSNHFRTEALRELGGWDPFNVTEDADLGVRASARGYRVAVLDSTTYEEANSRLGNFVRQRSRWIKGYMQTALVHSRHPLKLVRSIGLRSAFGFAALIGGTPLMFLIAPILWAMFLVFVLTRTTMFDSLYLDATIILSILNLLVGNALAIYLSMLAVFGRRRFDLVLWALLNPLYWLLHSLAAYKALWQLLFRPFYWEKTTHGLVDAGEVPDVTDDALLEPR